MCIQKDVREILVASKRASEGMLSFEIWNHSNLNLAHKVGTRKIPCGLRCRQLETYIRGCHRCNFVLKITINFVKLKWQVVEHVVLCP